MIRRHRARMMPGGIGYQENPTFGGFGPKSPCSEHAMEMGDLEAAFVGNLARYCMAMGSIPRKPIRGFWWVNGACRGLAGQGMDEDEFTLDGEHNGHDYLATIMPTINHLITHVGAVVATEGVEELLKAGEDTRWYSLIEFPMESEEEWVTLQKARNLTGKSERTLKRWAASGSVKVLGSGAEMELNRLDLETQMRVMRENMLRGYRSITEGKTVG